MVGKPIIAVIDTETTGVDIENDRIVTCFFGVMDVDGNWIEKKNWVIDPGVEIPKEASDVHKMTTEWVRANGMDPKAAITEIVERIISCRLPIAAYNITFDASLIDREAQRYGLGWVPEWPKCIDPLIVDRTIDKYRKGPRKLVNVAAHYGIEVDEEKAHAADYDCLLTGLIALRMRPKLKEMAPLEARSSPEAFMAWLQDWQRRSYAMWAAGLEKYLRSSGKEPEAVVQRAWPMVPRPVSS